MIRVERCPACRGTLRARFQVAAGGRPMSVSSCVSCGSFVKTPFFDPAELREIYAHYRHHEQRFEPGPGELDNLAEKVRRIERFLPSKGRLLEVGCGRGFLLAQALRRGWDARGVELEGSASDSLLPELRGRVTFIRGEDDFAGLEPGGYDAVCSYQVFEHLLRPAEALAAWARALRPGGVLVVDTPNAAGLGARRHGGRWVHHGAPEHFVLFTPASLEGLFRANGVAVLRRHFGGAPAVCAGSEGRSAAGRRVFRVRWLTRLLRTLAHRLGLGDNVEVTGRKRAAE